jgi:hypothetical protein
MCLLLRYILMTPIIITYDTYLYVTSPQFSIAPAANSVMQII